MKQEELTLMLVRGAIAGMPEEQRKKVETCADKLRAAIAEYGTEGKAACGLVAAELVVALET